MSSTNNEKDAESGVPLMAMPRASDVEKDLSGAHAEVKASPRSAGQAKKISIPAYIIIPIWMACSITVILYNKYIYDPLQFPYPVFLTTWHLAFSAIATRVLLRTTTLVDGVKDIEMTRDRFVKNILPIGALFSGSLILSNYAYLTLSVPFIQMLKAFNPVAILLISFAFRIQEPNGRLMLIVFMISLGCSLAAYGELHFEMFGFICQCLALLFEASRLIMIQLLLHGLKMDPIVSLHYFAPVCAAINLLIIPFTEGMEPFYALHRVGILVLFTNAGIAFALNVAAVFLISVGSGLILTLAGVFKDILLISASVLAFGSPITPIQVVGYSISLAGLVTFKQTGGK
ncbi:triose-phosphate transporter family-domain-containing protein [Kockovaella imperatae]|uniref:Triose-phosphate transporter family-domain-containing protein n=1 Tax=Kockovaella imperatae TaxID=4999 RepID=A0A1Y1UKW7_9TREE|nr:triose-phosphate transporter family-domain-containing protein [Kockovaella imperatae]ORX38639.1 triose-phosphate transporter family-domain-containing protein [Kockovaella imperatae]